jgi:hypothetical protein
MDELLLLKELAYIGVVEKVAGQMFCCCKAFMLYTIHTDRLSLPCFQQITSALHQRMLKAQAIHMIADLLPWVDRKGEADSFGRIFASWKPEKGEYRWLTNCSNFIGKQLDYTLQKVHTKGWQAMCSMCIEMRIAQHKKSGHVVTYNQFVSCTTEVLESMPHAASCTTKLDFSHRFEELPLQGATSVESQNSEFWNIVFQWKAAHAKSCLYYSYEGGYAFWAKPGFKRYAAKHLCVHITKQWLAESIALERKISYIELGTDILCKQQRGIFMGRRMSMLHSMILDWTLWFSRMRALCSAGDAARAEALQHTYQQADDLLNLDCPSFHEDALEIFKVATLGLELKRESLLDKRLLDVAVGVDVVMLDMRGTLVHGNEVAVQPANKPALKGRADKRFVAWEHTWVKNRALMVVRAQLVRLLLACNNLELLLPHWWYLVLHFLHRKTYPAMALIRALKGLASQPPPILAFRHIQIDIESAIQATLDRLASLAPR